MLNAEEKHEHLSHTVKDIANEIQSIQSITINGHKFNIELADRKYLIICLGLKAANTKYVYGASAQHDTSKSWCSIEDSKRTIEEIFQHLALQKNEEKYA